MKEELQLKLVEVVTSIQAAAGKAGEFALTQLPQIAQEYVIYGRVKTAVLTLLLLLLGGILLCAAVWAYKKPWNSSPYSIDREKLRSESNYVVIGFGTAFGTLFTVIAILSFDYLVWFAPKVWLIKELANLIR